MWIFQKPLLALEHKNSSQCEFCDFAITCLLSLTQNHFFNVWKSLHLCGFADNNSSLRSEGVKYPLIASCFLVGFLLLKKALDCRQRHIYSQTLLALECKSTFYVILQFCDNMTALFNVIITFKSVKKCAVVRVFWCENNYEFRTTKYHQKHSCFCHKISLIFRLNFSLDYYWTIQL